MAQTQYAEEPAGPPGMLTLLVGVGMVLVDVAVVYTLLAGSGLPEVAVYGVTALVAGVVGGSFLVVVGRRFLGSTPSSDAVPPSDAVSSDTMPSSDTSPSPRAEPSTLARLGRVVVSITVLTGVTFLLGYGGGLLLALSTAVGGPDPETADGTLLRDRLLDWPERNREFMHTDGYGELPLQP